MQMVSTKLTTFLLILVAVFALGACSSGGDTSSKKTTASPSTSYTVKHAMGTTKIKGTPKRVVILTNEGTEALLAMGVKPVGAVQSWEGNPWYDHIKDQMKGVKVVGTEDQPNLEEIASLKPDLIIGNKMRQEKIYKQLSAIAPTVFSDVLRGDWKENFKLYAKALHKEKEGNEVIAKFDNRVKELKQKLGDKTKMKVSVVRFVPGDVRIYHKDTFSGVILDQLGFARPASQDKNDFAEQHVTKERASAMDGDILFYFTYDTGDNKGNELEKDWISDPIFKNLSVSKNHKVYKVDDAIWNTAGGVIAANLMLDDIEKYFLNDQQS